jgi:hypothetical protein
MRGIANKRGLACVGDRSWRRQLQDFLVEEAENGKRIRLGGKIANLKSPKGPMVQSPIEIPLPLISNMTIASAENRIASSNRVAAECFRLHRAVSIHAAQPKGYP